MEDEFDVEHFRTRVQNCNDQHLILAISQLSDTEILRMREIILGSEEGYHQFLNEDGEPYGSFLVYEEDEEWYWVAQSPGCLPDGEPSGPFVTSIEAYNDAIDC